MTGDVREDSELPSHIIHIPVVLHDIDAAFELAASLALSLAFVPEIDVGEVTVSAEDQQHVRYRLFCDRRLGGGGRCDQREGHSGDCLSTAIVAPSDGELGSTAT